MRRLGLFGLLAAVCSMPGSAEQTWPCDITPAVRQIQTALLPGSPARDQRVEEIRGRLNQHPGDPESLYLYGLSLMGPKTREAIAWFEKAAAADAGFPWPRKTLAQIYSTQLQDPGKLAANLKAYLKLCPGSLDAYHYLKDVDDRELLSDAAKDLRARLAARTDSQAVSLYLALWSAEWRTVAAAEREPLRRRIVADLERLKQIQGDQQRVALYVVRDGYRMIGDKAGEQAAEASLRASAPVSRTPPEMSAWAAQVDAYLKAAQPDKARRVLGEMEKWIDYNKPTLAQQGQYFESRAALAAFEGKKLDAIAFYQRAIGAGRSGALAKARELWKELGGSEEAWLAFSRPVEPRPAWVPGPAWALKDNPLPAMELKDMRGRTWTLAHIKGKNTLINVWATWCPPCRVELPYLQKMYDQLKERADVQVLTFNVDHETELVQPFLKENKYTFPVLLASALLDPTLSIPRNWIVDKDAILREEATGFGSDGERWMQATLAKLLAGPRP